MGYLLPVFTELDNSSTPLLLMGVTIALIQPINSDIPRLDAPVIYIGAFPILTAVGQYTTNKPWCVFNRDSYLIILLPWQLD